MRVALVGNYPIDPNKIVGGPQAVFTYLVEGLRQLEGLDLYVVTNHKQMTEITKFQRDNVTFYFLPHPRLPFELAYPLLKRRIHQTLHQIKPDLVHAQSVPTYGSLCLGAGYPTVATAHSLPGVDTLYNANWLSRTRMTLYQEWAARAFLPNSRHIISISKYIQQGLAPRTRANFYPIDNPVTNTFFELPIDQAVPGRILFVGLLRQRKRPDLALEALALARQDAPELHLQFAGAATEPMLEAKMRDFIARNALERNVELLGHLQETQLLEAYRNMSILLLTSDLETSPMAIEQAMAAGKVVVATAVGGVPFLVDDGRTGILVEPQKPERIAQAMVKLSRDQELRRKMGQAARQEAQERFKPEVVAAKTYAVYRKVMRDSRH